VLSPNVSCTAQNLVVKATTTPGNSGARTFTLVVDGEPTTVTCTATDPAVTCNSGAATVPIFAGSELALRIDQNAASNALCGIEFSWECN